jgi:hypothetical protein
MGSQSLFNQYPKFLELLIFRIVALDNHGINLFLTVTAHQTIVNNVLKQLDIIFLQAFKVPVVKEYIGFAQVKNPHLPTLKNIRMGNAIPFKTHRHFKQIEHLTNMLKDR